MAPGPRGVAMSRLVVARSAACPLLRVAALASVRSKAPNVLMLRLPLAVFLPVALALGASAAAQVRSSLETATTVGVRAGAFAPATDSLPAHTPQAGLRTLSAAYSGTGAASART